MMTAFDLLQRRDGMVILVGIVSIFAIGSVVLGVVMTFEQHNMSYL